MIGGVADGFLPRGWTTVSLKAIATKLADGSHNPPGKRESGVPMLSARNILNNQIVFGGYRLISEEDFEREHTRTRISPGDVLLTIVGTIGRSAVVPASAKRFALQRSVAVITPTGVLPKYLMYQFQAPFLQRHFERSARGTAQKGVYLKTLGQTPILVAPLEQQERIVAEIEKQFSRLDEAVANLNRVRANLKRYKAAVLKAAVEGKLTEDWRKQNPDVEPASKLLERILAERRAKSKDKGVYVESAAPDIDNFPALPKGWIWTSLGQLFEVYVGATPSRVKQEYWDGAIPWVSSGEVAFCRIRKTKERITEKGLANSSAKLHPQGTVLLGMIGEGKTRGQVAILDIAACNNQNSAAIRVSETGIPSEYVYRYLEGQYEENRLLGSGNNQPALNKARVQRIPLPLPPTNEQQQIVGEVERRLSVIEELESAIEANLTRSDRLRQAILQRSFSGELI